MAQHRLTVSEARKNLSGLLKQLVEDPEAVFEITVNGIPVGELRSVEREPYRPVSVGTFGRAIAKAGDPQAPQPGSTTARDHDDFLYRR